MRKALFRAIQIVVIIWTVYFSNIIYFRPTNNDLINFGCILPRNFQKLYAVLTSLFVHANFEHLLANTVAIFVLTFLLYLFHQRNAFFIWLLIALFSGLGTWLIGRPHTCHIGISGVIFGLIGFFLSYAFFRKTFKDLLVGVMVFFAYGGTIFSGILPQNPHISWEGHLMGFLSGIFVAYLFRNSAD